MKNVQLYFPNFSKTYEVCKLKIKGGIIMLAQLANRRLFPSLVDQFFGKDLMPDLFDWKAGFDSPAVNVVEGKDDFKIEVAVPGLEKKDFKIELDNNTLTISSQKEETKENNDGKYMRREFNYSSFSRSFTLPNIVNINKIAANHKDGVLHITLPKKEVHIEKPTKMIDIQ